MSSTATLEIFEALSAQQLAARGDWAEMQTRLGKWALTIVGVCVTATVALVELL